MFCNFFVETHDTQIFKNKVNQCSVKNWQEITVENISEPSLFLVNTFQISMARWNEMFCRKVKREYWCEYYWGPYVPWKPQDVASNSRYNNLLSYRQKSQAQKDKQSTLWTVFATVTAVAFNHQHHQSHLSLSLSLCLIIFITWYLERRVPSLAMSAGLSFPSSWCKGGQFSSQAWQSEGYVICARI